MNGQNIEKIYNILSKSQGLKSLYLQYKLTVILLMARKKKLHFVPARPRGWQS